MGLCWLLMKCFLHLLAMVVLCVNTCANALQLPNNHNWMALRSLQFVSPRFSYRPGQKQLLMCHTSAMPQSPIVSSLRLDGMSIDTANILRRIFAAADSRKAVSIVALDIHNVTTIASYMVLIESGNKIQNLAIADFIEVSSSCINSRKATFVTTHIHRYTHALS